MRFLFLLLSPLSLQAQFTYTLDQSVPVEVNGKTLLNPWAGGLNSPQINTMDLNADGQPDLVIFDKTASKISTFVAQNKTYLYAPEYEVIFPKEISTFFLLRDYNCDGKKDLFTFGQIGVLVFQNVTLPGKPVTWKKLSFYNSTTGLSSEVLLTTGFSGKINLLPGTNDLPNFTDMDGDGDLDVVNMRFVSPSTAEYHKNFSMERYGRCDSLDLERQTQNWGGFEECSCGKIAFGKTCVQIGGRAEHTGGKSLLALDMDNDGDKDLLFSEETCSRIYYMQNQGDATNAVMNGFSLFPATNPVGILLYPAPYLEDVDFDGKTDLLSAPNLYVRTQPQNNFAQSLWYYKNTGTNQLPQFTFVKNNFLQEDMFDEGDFSAPAWVDIDQDGDPDLFIGKYINSNLKSSISYYQNTGTVHAPSFKFITDDFLNISSISFYNIKPQFVDFDRNGGPDLLFTAIDPITGLTNLFYALSTSTSAPSFGGQDLLTLKFLLGTNENVTAVDVDQDGNVDLLVGRNTGSLEYWRNTGKNLAFSLANGKYLGLGETLLRQNIATTVGDLDGDGRDDLVVGDQAGNLSVYSDFRNSGANPQPVTGLVFDSFSKSYTSRNFGGKLRPVIANLFGTDKSDILVGNTLGGIYLLKNENGQPISPEPSVTIFPNPVPFGGSISIKSDRNATMEVFTVLGQRIGSTMFIPANQITLYPVQGVSPGVYIARFSVGSKILAQRFIIH